MTVTHLSMMLSMRAEATLDSVQRPGSWINRYWQQLGYTVPETFMWHGES